MKLSEIKALTNEQLIIEFGLNQIEITKRVNSSRGVAKTTITTEERLIQEISKRFGVNYQEIKDGLNV